MWQTLIQIIKHCICIWIMKQICLSYFLYGFKIKASTMHEQVMNKQEHVNNAYEHFKENSNIFKEFK